MKTTLSSRLVLGGCMFGAVAWAQEVKQVPPPADRRVPPRQLITQPTAAPTPQPDEYVQESFERQRELAKGLVLVEKYEKGIGRNIHLTASCPTGMIAISGGGENSGMPVFHLVGSYPMGDSRWRVVFSRDQAPVGPGTVGPTDLQPPSPYGIMLSVFCVDRNLFGKAMTAAATQ